MECTLGSSRRQRHASRRLLLCEQTVCAAFALDKLCVHCVVKLSTVYDGLHGAADAATALDAGSWQQRRLSRGCCSVSSSVGLLQVVPLWDKVFGTVSEWLSDICLVICMILL
jgi:hypothetical protein